MNDSQVLIRQYYIIYGLKLIAVSIPIKNIPCMRAFYSDDDPWATSHDNQKRDSYIIQRGDPEGENDRRRKRE